MLEWRWSFCLFTLLRDVDKGQMGCNFWKWELLKLFPCDFSLLPNWNRVLHRDWIWQCDIWWHAMWFQIYGQQNTLKPLSFTYKCLPSGISFPYNLDRMNIEFHLDCRRASGKTFSDKMHFAPYTLEFYQFAKGLITWVRETCTNPTPPTLFKLIITFDTKFKKWRRTL